jgi:hypothetical protein
MKAETLIWIALLGFGGYFVWKKLGSPTVSVNPLAPYLPGANQ